MVDFYTFLLYMKSDRGARENPALGGGEQRTAGSGGVPGKGGGGYAVRVGRGAGAGAGS